jgi:fructose-1,6-bisphosphatase/inositol monophosphatase family enzyme
VLERLPTRAEREPVVGAGLGGDETTAIDQAAEDAISPGARRARARALEEVGRLGDERGRSSSSTRSTARSTRSAASVLLLSIAVAEGDDGRRRLRLRPRLRLPRGVDGRRGEGAWLDGELLGAERPKDEIEILSFEATRTSSSRGTRRRSRDLAHRLRIMGSLALSLCHSPPVASTPSAR